MNFLVLESCKVTLVAICVFVVFSTKLLAFIRRKIKYPKPDSTPVSLMGTSSLILSEAESSFYVLHNLICEWLSYQFVSAPLSKLVEDQENLFSTNPNLSSQYLKNLCNYCCHEYHHCFTKIPWGCFRKQKMQVEGEWWETHSWVSEACETSGG